MRKQKPYIFAYLVCFLLMQGCGVKGPLYQTPQDQVKQQAKKDVNLTSDQQEK